MLRIDSIQPPVNLSFDKVVCRDTRFLRKVLFFTLGLISSFILRLHLAAEKLNSNEQDCSNNVFKHLDLLKFSKREGKRCGSDFSFSNDETDTVGWHFLNALRNAIENAGRKEEILNYTIQSLVTQRDALTSARYVMPTGFNEFYSKQSRNDLSVKKSEKDGPLASKNLKLEVRSFSALVDKEVAAAYPNRVKDCMELQDACKIIQRWIVQVEIEAISGARMRPPALNSEKMVLGAANTFDYGLGELKASFDSCSNQLWKSCRCQVATKASIRKSDKKVEDKRNLPGIKAPEHLWKRSIESYPGGVTVSFLLQYFRQPKNAPQIVNQLYQWTEGNKGTDLLPGVSTELVVHVDEPSGYKMWLELWKSTKVGSFVKLIFSHDIQEVRGYNRAAHVAKGKMLILLQDDEIAPQPCGWLLRTLRAFDAFPRLGMLGMRASHFYIPEDCAWCNLDNRYATDMERMVYMDKKTNIRLQFVTVVDSSPSVYPRSIYLELGEQDEGLMGKKGESGIYCDWEMAIRVWLAGYQVVILAIDEEEQFMNPPGVMGGTHIGRQGWLRNQNYVLMMDHWYMEVDKIFDEVKRVNQLFLTQIQPWL